MNMIENTAGLRGGTRRRRWLNLCGHAGTCDGTLSKIVGHRQSPGHEKRGVMVWLDRSGQRTRVVHVAGLWTRCSVDVVVVGCV